MLRPWVCTLPCSVSTVAIKLPVLAKPQSYALFLEAPTIRKAAYCEHIPMPRNICKCYIWRSFSDHQMHCDQTLEYHSPCRIPQPVLQSPEHFCHACFSRMCSNEDMLDVPGKGLILAQGLDTAQEDSYLDFGGAAWTKLLAVCDLVQRMLRYTDLNLGCSLHRLLE